MTKIKTRKKELSSKEEKKEKTDKKIEILLEDLASLETYILELFTFTPLPICFVSPIGVILEFNPAFEKISGYKFYEIVGEEMKKLFGDKESKKLVAETLESGEVWAKESFILGKNKKRVPVSVFSRIRKDEEEKTVGFFAGVFDLTEIKKREKKIREKVEELEKFQKIAIGRELKMINLKEELSRLKQNEPRPTTDG